MIRDTLLHDTGHVVTTYGARCYMIRGTLLHDTGHVVTNYGARCYNIRGTLLHHKGHVVTTYGALCCYSKERVDCKTSVTRTSYCYYINWVIHTYNLIHNVPNVEFTVSYIKVLIFSYQRGLILGFLDNNCDWNINY